MSFLPKVKKWINMPSIQWQMKKETNHVVVCFIREENGEEFRIHAPRNLFYNFQNIFLASDEI